jgi:hypothetical protein
MNLFVITHNTLDYGDKFVVRVHTYHDLGKSRQVTTPHTPYFVGDTLEDARDAIMRYATGLMRLERIKQDDTVIVESWGVPSAIAWLATVQHAIVTGAFL